MTEEPKDAPLEGAEELKAPPVPEVSAGSTDAGSAVPGFDADALADKVIEKLSPTLDEKVDARFKSGKDIRFAKVEEIASWVEASGGDFSKIRGALTESELMTRIEALEAGSGGAVGTVPDEDTVEDKTADILDEAGILYDDPVIAELSKQSYKTDDDWYHAVNREVAKRAKQASVGPSATVGEAGKPVDYAPTGEAYEVLATELAGLMSKSHSHENMVRRKEILEEMEALNPPTETVIVG